MVQQFVTESMVSQGVSVPESGQRPSSGRREILTPPLSRHQPQSKIQDTVTVHHSAPGWQPAVVAPAMNGKSRSRCVELPPMPSKGVKGQGSGVREKPPKRGEVLNSPSARHKPLFPLNASSRERRNPPSGSQSPTEGNPPSGMSHRTRLAPPDPRPLNPSSAPHSLKKRSFQGKRTRSSAAPLLYALRLLIFGVGIGVIAGTLLSVLDPTSLITAEGSHTRFPETQQEKASVEAVPASVLKLSQEIMPLKTVVQQLATKNAKLMPGVFFVDLDNGAYLDLNGSSSFASASMIKFPILVAFFQDVDAGKIRLDEIMTLKQELIGGGSGDMQYKPPGTKFTVLETATKMITISDNTATNMLIARLGGAKALNQRFQSWGLMATQIHNPLPDLSGTNTTSPRDLGNLMALVNQGNLISLKSRDRLLDIMRRTVTNTLLPQGLGKGAIIAHKTGDIGSLVGDVGLVDMPSGKRYIAVVMVKRPNNDSRAQELIRQFSRAAYQQFNKPLASKIIRPTPGGTATPVTAGNTTASPTTRPN